MSHALVSVIIPCYRQARFLPDALESVFQQTYPAVEVIVINDGSDDDTHEAALRYGPRLKYIRQANSGPSAARNKGIRAATGKYLYFLDADDWIGPESISKLVASISATSNTLALMGHRYFENGAQQDGYAAVLPVDRIGLFPKLFSMNIAPIHCFLTPAEMVHDIQGFDEDLRACEDWDLWARMALRGAEMRAVDYCGAYYRQYPGSSSSNKNGMARGRRIVIGRIATAIADDPALRHRWGSDLYWSLQAILRTKIAQKSDSGETDEMLSLMRRLRQRGVRGASSLGKRFADWLLGSSSEFWTMRYLRLFEPDVYDRYRSNGTGQSHSVASLS